MHIIAPGMDLKSKCLLKPFDFWWNTKMHRFYDVGLVKRPIRDAYLFSRNFLDFQ